MYVTFEACRDGKGGKMSTGVWGGEGGKRKSRVDGEVRSIMFSVFSPWSKARRKCVLMGKGKENRQGKAKRKVREESAEDEVKRRMWKRWIGLRRK